MKNIKLESLEDLLVFAEKKFDLINNSSAIQVLLTTAFLLGERKHLLKGKDIISNDSKAIGQSMADGCNSYFDTLN